MKKYIEPMILVKEFGGENVITTSNLNPVANISNYVDKDKQKFSADKASYVLLWN